MKKNIVAVLLFMMLSLCVQGCVTIQSEDEEMAERYEEEEKEEEEEETIEEDVIEAEVVAVSRTYSDWHFAYMVLYYSESTGYDEVYISSVYSNHSIEFDDTKDVLYISKDKDGYIYRLVLTPTTYKEAPIFFKR